jgi:hypothetical protein
MNDTQTILFQFRKCDTKIWYNHSGFSIKFIIQHINIKLPFTLQHRNWKKQKNFRVFFSFGKSKLKFSPAIFFFTKSYDKMVYSLNFRCNFLLLPFYFPLFSWDSYCILFMLRYVWDRCDGKNLFSYLMKIFFEFKKLIKVNSLVFREGFENDLIFGRIFGMVFLECRKFSKIWVKFQYK